MSNPAEGVTPEENEVVENSDDFAALEFTDSEVPDSEPVVEDDDDEDEDADSESDDFEEWEPVDMDWDKLKSSFNAEGYAKRKGQFLALTGVFQYLWSELNRTMGKAHQVLQADRKAHFEFANSEDYADVRTALEDKREEIAADEKPFDDEIAKITKAFNDRIAAINANKQAAVGDRIAETDKLEADTVAGIKSSLLTDLGSTDDAVGEMQDIAKQIRETERMSAWLVKQKKRRRNGDEYTKEVPVFSFPIPSWTKTLGKDGVGSVVAGEEGKKRVVKINFLSIDGVEYTGDKRTLTYARNKLGLAPKSVTETVTKDLLDALNAAGLTEPPVDKDFSFTVLDNKGEPHTLIVRGRPSDS